MSDGDDRETDPAAPGGRDAGRSAGSGQGDNRGARTGHQKDHPGHFGHQDHQDHQNHQPTTDLDHQPSPDTGHQPTTGGGRSAARHRLGRGRRGRASCPVCAGPIGRPIGGPLDRGRSGRPDPERGFCPRCRAPYSFAPPLSAGDVAGGYRIVACLATGGPGPAGWVYLADDPGHGRQVVLKSLRRSGPGPAGLPGSLWGPRRPDPPLRHPAIVGTLGEVRHGGVVYLVMEYVAGPSLTELLWSRRQARGGVPAPLPVAAAVDGGLRLLSALEHVHDRGYVFCDLAPGNVVWNGDRVTLIDLQSLRETGRRTGTFYVTTGFDAPELTVSPPSVGSDLYALGRLLATAVLDFPHRASTYRYTLPDQEVDQVLARHESLRRFLLRATAADPAHRFADAGDMTAALARIAAEITPGGTVGGRKGGATGGNLTRSAEHPSGLGVLQSEHPSRPRARARATPGGGAEINDVDAPRGSCQYSSRRPWI